MTVLAIDNRNFYRRHQDHLNNTQSHMENTATAIGKTIDKNLTEHDLKLNPKEKLTLEKMLPTQLESECLMTLLMHEIVTRFNEHTKRSVQTPKQIDDEIAVTLSKLKMFDYSFVQAECQRESQKSAKSTKGDYDR